MRTAAGLVFAGSLVLCATQAGRAEIAAPPAKKMCASWAPTFGSWTFQRTWQPNTPSDGTTSYQEIAQSIGTDVTLNVHEVGHGVENNGPYMGTTEFWNVEGTAASNTGMTGTLHLGRFEIWTDESGVQHFDYGDVINWNNGYYDRQTCSECDNPLQGGRRSPPHAALYDWYYFGRGTVASWEDIQLHSSYRDDKIQEAPGPVGRFIQSVPLQCVRAIDESTLKATALKDSGRIAEVPIIDPWKTAAAEARLSPSRPVPAGDAQMRAFERAREQSAAGTRTSNFRERDNSSPDNNARVNPDTALRMANAVGHLPAPGGSQAMTGTFDSDFGVLTLSANAGSYAYHDGRVSITALSGAAMDGTWEESSGSHRCADGRYRGRFHFDFSGNGFTGRFGYCDDQPGAGRWNGTRR